MSHVLEQDHFVGANGDVIHAVHVVRVVRVRVGRALDDPGGEVEHTPTGGYPIGKLESEVGGV